MKIKSIWTNYKIYAVIIGLLMGTLVYNLIGIDFYYCRTDNIHNIKFGKMIIYLIISGIKFWIIILGISFLKYKRIVLFLIILVDSFFIAGCISISIIIKNIIYLYEVPNYVSKMFCSILLFKENKKIKDIILSILAILSGSFISSLMVFMI